MSEILQFKTSQNLLNPNEYNTVKQQNDGSKSNNNEKDPSIPCTATQDLFAAHHIERSCAAIVDNSGYDKTYTNAISLLANVATDLMRKIATTAQLYAEHVGNRQTTVENVIKAVEDNGISAADLLRYMKTNNPYTTKALPLFPVLHGSTPAKLSENVQNALCEEFGSLLIRETYYSDPLKPSLNSITSTKRYIARPPTLPKKKIKVIIRPMRSASIKTANIFDELHNDKRPFDFDCWEVTAAELKLLTMPPVRPETTDDMANAVKPPSYWEKRDQNLKYENNYNWADEDCSSDSEISLIDSIVLSPRPIDDSTPPIKLRDAIETSYANPSESIIHKNDTTPALKDTRKKLKVVKGARRKNVKPPVAKAASNIDLQRKRPHCPRLAKAISSTNTSQPGIKMVLRRANFPVAPTETKSDYEVVFCSTKTSAENNN